VSFINRQEANKTATGAKCKYDSRTSGGEEFKSIGLRMHRAKLLCIFGRPHSEGKDSFFSSHSLLHKHWLIKSQTEKDSAKLAA
jgi:hypothetical protein